jgi:protein-S-isoprenylcysteine O-methyltransferase Ste14
LFLVVTLVAGTLLRRRREPASAESLSRISHLAFWLALVLPWAVGMFVPGPAALDRLAGPAPLPLPQLPRIAVGGVLLVAGVVVMQLSISRLGKAGHGAPALKLTSAVVASGLYAVVRNPMALGFYLGLLGGALLSGSTYVLAYTCLGVIPAHLLNLRFFEELELTLRYGESYERYRQTTPFLIPRLGPRAGG